MRSAEEPRDTASEPSTDDHLPDEGGDPACWAHLFDEDADGPP